MNEFKQSITDFQAKEKEKRSSITKSLNMESDLNENVNQSTIVSTGTPIKSQFGAHRKKRRNIGASLNNAGSNNLGTNQMF